jgi:hypothetical protein
MTEAEWLAATDPTPMVRFLEGKVSDRKLRLFGCGCCRRAWDLLVRKPSRAAVEAAEAYADGLLDAASLRAARNAARNAANLMAKKEIPFNGQAIYAAGAVQEICWIEFLGWNGAAYTLCQRFVAPNAASRERKAQADMLRDIFGNPFHPVALNPSWLTSTVLALAIGIYEERAFDRLPILADALQDAGCDNEDILNHCRESCRVHVRGCFVVDLVLGKS